jgi:hypothetical protein
MKISKEFALREIAGNYIVVPFGETTLSFNTMIALNATGAFLWKQLEEEKSEQQLMASMLEEYDTDAETAKADIARFVEKLVAAEIIRS